MRILIGIQRRIHSFRLYDWLSYHKTISESYQSLAAYPGLATTGFGETTRPISTLTDLAQ